MVERWMTFNFELYLRFFGLHLSFVEMVLTFLLGSQIGDKNQNEKYITLISQLNFI